MKGKVIAALGVLAATALLIVSMAVLPEYVSEYSVQTPAPEPSPTVPVQPGEPAAANSTVAAEPVPGVSTPLPTQQELAEMDERLREAVPRMSLFERAFRWRYSGPDNMPQDEHDNARALYMRFLDNFAGIRTAQFRFERYEEQADGSQQLLYVHDVWWEGDRSLRRERMEATRFGKDEKPLKQLLILDGRTWKKWNDGVFVEQEKTSWGYADGYLHRNQMAALRERRPYILSFYGHCEVDDGTNGFSRIWGESGAEVRFDTATGLLTEQQLYEGYRQTFTYQNINGTWFPKETVSKTIYDGKTIESREVFSRVVLNERMDDALFDVDKPFDRITGWTGLR